MKTRHELDIRFKNRKIDRYTFVRSSLTNCDQHVYLLFDFKNSLNQIKSSANLFLAGFSHLELTVSRPGEKAVSAEDGW